MLWYVTYIFNLVFFIEQLFLMERELNKFKYNIHHEL